MVPVDECRQLLRSLEIHYQEFLRHSQDSRSFQPDDRLHVEREYNACTHKYELLLRTQEKGEAPPPHHPITLSPHGASPWQDGADWPRCPAGEQDESLCRSFISQLKDIRLQLEGCESRTVHKIRLPLGKDPAAECAQRIAEQQVPPRAPGAGTWHPEQGPGHPDWGPRIQKGAFSTQRGGLRSAEWGSWHPGWGSWYPE